MIPYVSIDLETTGLDPATCQILEFGAVIDNGHPDVEALPKFRVILAHKEIHGEPYAIQMNAAIIKEIAFGKSPDLREPGGVTADFLEFLENNGIDISKGFQPAGKNFASFDRPFLEQQMPRWKSDVKIKHRTIDPGNLFWMPGVEYIPDTKTCNERAGLPPFVAHTAVEDAIGVIRQIREYKANLERVARNLESGTKFTEAFGFLQASLHPSLHVSSDPMEMARAIVRYHQEGQPGDN